jgi:hypothetical protein
MPLLGKLRAEALAQLPPGAVAREEDGGTTFGIERPWSSFSNEHEKKVWIAERLRQCVPTAVEASRLADGRVISALFS